MLEICLSPRSWGLPAARKKVSVKNHRFLQDSQGSPAFLPISQRIDALQTKSPSVPSTDDFFECVSAPPNGRETPP